MTKKKKGPKSKYRSNLEKRLHEGPMKALEHEPKGSKVDYVIYKTYLPDFVSPNQPNVLYEAKGRFRTYEEAKKYIWIRESNPNLTIRFIIMNPNSRAYPQTKQTLGQWLDKQGFEWCTEDNVPEDWKK